MAETRQGRVQTVTGLIDPVELGNTMMHEHIFINYLDFFVKPTAYDQKNYGLSCCCSGQNQHDHDLKPEDLVENQPITLKNLHFIQTNYNKNLSNLVLDQHDVALKELEVYKRLGGKTIVDVTTAGIGRTPQGLLKISKESQLNIVMGAGYYVEKTIGKMVSQLSEQEMEDEIVKQVLEGVDGSGIKAGIIGEVGCSWPLSENEKKSLRASARAQKRTGVSITIHPGRSVKAPEEILSIIKEAGGDLSRVIIGHLDRTIHDLPTMLYLIESTGCVLEFDLFGMEISFYPYGTDVVGMANDNQRMEWIRDLCLKGHQKNIVISHDVYTKNRLVTYGGHGYHHILFNILPRMEKLGISKDQINDIIVNNPKRLLTIV
ncbi:phosphotriesterase-related protein [Tieghemostelium lacteum]|uniref:Phosphotriesterase-related protein n=1 Tax=Tieghemostelium lacteum TaxID=361077 RepID=A0A151Z997_TIELA|nr:phosphotriesterase-related protein [Tieghemostelium lacteum]|eukprot:KYQ90530.1 phosphotriesterase-related protein [Tieghemostelium lacteum]